MKFNNLLSVRNLAIATVSGIFALASCTTSNDSILSANDTQAVNSESAAASYTSETADISNAVTSNVGDAALSGARTEGLIFPVGSLRKWDKRLACAKVTITHSAGSTKDNPQGTITIYYDSTTTCSDTTNVQRKGTIIITYSGRRFAKGSYRSLTYQNYSRNGVKVKGTYKITNVTDSTSASLKFEHVITGGQVIFTDGKTVTRDQDIIVQWNRGANPQSDTFAHLAGGTATGIHKDGKAYSMVITSDLIYSVPCMLSNKIFIPVKGSKTVTITGGREYSIDYGTGDCDNIAVITVNGKSKTITVNGDGN
ncbi:MAG: hypothetical protein JSS79_05695 [Bacteroidetes bacterium]|nr:hypothetical protein [Bacteroidota bacterium]